MKLSIPTNSPKILSDLPDGIIGTNAPIAYRSSISINHRDSKHSLVGTYRVSFVAYIFLNGNIRCKLSLSLLLLASGFFDLDPTGTLALMPRSLLENHSLFFLNFLLLAGASLHFYYSLALTPMPRSLLNHYSLFSLNFLLLAGASLLLFSSTFTNAPIVDTVQIFPKLSAASLSVDSD